MPLIIVHEMEGIFRILGETTGDREPLELLVGGKMIVYSFICCNDKLRLM